MSLDPSVRFFWAPMEWTSKCVTPTKCNTAVVNMPFEELFEVSGQPLPFVQTLVAAKDCGRRRLAIGRFPTRMQA